MVRTTPPRPVDVEALVPEVAPFRRTAIRLHPRPGDPGPLDSSVGGPLLWPADEPWPVCPEPVHSHSIEWPAVKTTNEPVPLVSIVQIHRRDVPQLAFPDGSDLLQVLWCPFIIDGCAAPAPRVYWRDAEAIEQVRRDVPDQVDIAPEGLIPSACVVHPEQVTEYPTSDLPFDLLMTLLPRFETLREETGWIFEHHLAAAPGIKLGGYPSWKQESCWPSCTTCGTKMEHLLTVDSWEFDGSTWRTWLPVEDRGGATGRENRAPREAVGSAVSEAAGIMIGDAGGIYIFECVQCPDRPVRWWWDCS
ncbi:hypothetical protein ABH935_004110 [Catenulispora sp. GAS73]